MAAAVASVVPVVVVLMPPKAISERRDGEPGDDELGARPGPVLGGRGDGVLLAVGPVLGVELDHRPRPEFAELGLEGLL